MLICICCERLRIRKPLPFEGRRWGKNDNRLHGQRRSLCITQQVRWQSHVYYGASIAERVEYLRYIIRSCGSLIHVFSAAGDEDFHLVARLFPKEGDKFVYRFDWKKPVYSEIPLSLLMGGAGSEVASR